MRALGELGQSLQILSSTGEGNSGWVLAGSPGAWTVPSARVRGGTSYLCLLRLGPVPALCVGTGFDSRWAVDAEGIDGDTWKAVE